MKNSQIRASIAGSFFFAVIVFGFVYRGMKIRRKEIDVTDYLYMGALVGMFVAVVIYIISEFWVSVFYWYSTYKKIIF